MKSEKTVEKHIYVHVTKHIGTSAVDKFWTMKENQASRMISQDNKVQNL